MKTRTTIVMTLVVLAIAMLAIVPLNACAEIFRADVTLATEWWGSGNPVNNWNQYTVTGGTQFSIDRDTTINALGALVRPEAYGGAPNGNFLGDVSVGLWNSNGTSLIRTATVHQNLSQDTVIGSYAYVPVAQITLAPGTYHLGAYLYNAMSTPFERSVTQYGECPERVYTRGTGVTWGPSNLRLSFAEGVGLTYPGSWDAWGRMAPANAFWIPEPGTIILLGMAALGLLARRRRRS